LKTCHARPVDRRSSPSCITLAHTRSSKRYPQSPSSKVLLLPTRTCLVFTAYSMCRTSSTVVQKRSCSYFGMECCQQDRWFDSTRKTFLYLKSDNLFQKMIHLYLYTKKQLRSNNRKQSNVLRTNLIDFDRSDHVLKRRDLIRCRNVVQICYLMEVSLTNFVQTEISMEQSSLQL
jgi:hypothetical protein